MWNTGSSTSTRATGEIDAMSQYSIPYTGVYIGPPARETLRLIDPKSEEGRAIAAELECDLARKRAYSPVETHQGAVRRAWTGWKGAFYTKRG